MGKILTYTEKSTKNVKYSIGLIFLASILASLKSGDASLVPFSSTLTILTPLLCLLMVNKRLKLISNNNLFVVLMLLYVSFLFSIMSSFWSGEQLLSAQRALLAFGSAFVMYLLINGVGSMKGIKEVFIVVSKVIFYSTLVLSLLSLFLYYLGELYYIDGKRFYGIDIGLISLKQRVSGFEPFIRLSSLTSNPNVLGRYLATSILLSLALFKLNKIRPLFFYLALLIQFIALIHTFSRTSILMAISGLLIFFLINAKHKYKKIIAAIPIIIIVSLIMISSGFFSRISSIDTDRLHIGLTGREKSWEKLLNAVYESPILGSGFGVNNEVILTDLASSHNVYLSILADIGVVGFTLFLLFLLFTIYISLRLLSQIKFFNEHQRTIIASLIAIFYSIIIHQFFESNIFYFDFMNYLWIFIIVNMALIERMAYSEHEKNKAAKE